MKMLKAGTNVSCGRELNQQAVACTSKVSGLRILVITTRCAVMCRCLCCASIRHTQHNNHTELVLGYRSVLHWVHWASCHAMLCVRGRAEVPLRGYRACYTMYVYHIRRTLPGLRSAARPEGRGAPEGVRPRVCGCSLCVPSSTHTFPVVHTQVHTTLLHVCAVYLLLVLLGWNACSRYPSVPSHPVASPLQPS